MDSHEIEEYRELIAKAVDRERDARLELMASTEVRQSLQKSLNRIILSNKDIFDGDVVSVSFSEGTERCIFEGFSSMYSGTVIVKLRHFTKRGKPMKHISTYPISIIEHFSRVKSLIAH